MVIRMLRESERRMEKKSENFNKDSENKKKESSRIEYNNEKNFLKTRLEGVNSRLDDREE